MTIGEKIFKYRKQAGLSQEELAYKLNVTRQSVSLWETDQTMPSLESLIMLAEIFAVGLDDLCGTSTKTAEKAQPPVPKKSECLASVQTTYTPELLEYINESVAGKFYTKYIICLILALCLAIRIIMSDIDNVYLIIPICFAILFTASIIRTVLSFKKSSSEFIKLYPGSVVTIKLFQDYFDIEVTSDNRNSKTTLQYCDIKKVVNGKMILIYYGNSVAPIEKNLPDTNYDLILKLLNTSSVDTDASQNKKITVLLLTMFILSLLSIFMALTTLSICMQFSPLPSYPYSMLEYIWTFFLFIPLPLASAILGIVFYAKNYKCKKNIVAGLIMCFLLLIFGSFTFFFKDYLIHDFGYVHELEQTISIDLPDSGYISYANKDDPSTKSFAMIKFDDANEIHKIVSTDERFSNDTSFIPSNFIDMYYVSITSNYNYFMLFDATNNEANVIPDTQSKEHRFIFIAYNIDKNILFVLDFVK